MKQTFSKNKQYYKFCLYGFLKNLRFYEPFLLIFLLQKLEGNYAQALSLYSVRFIIRTILEIPSGVIADALGRIKSLLLAYGFYILSFLAYYFAESFLWLLLPSILFGIGDAFRTGTHKAMIIEYLRINNWINFKTSYYGYTRSWSQAGSAISSIIAAIIVIFAKNIDVVFLAAIVPLLVGFFLLTTYPNELDRKYPKSSIIKKLKQSFISSWHILSKKKNILLLINTSFYFGFHNSVKDLLQPIIQSVILVIPIGFAFNDEQRTAILIAIFYFLIYFLSIIASRSAGKVGKYFKNSLVTINSLSIIGISISIIISVFLLLDIPALAAILFLPFFSIISMQRPSVVSRVSENIDNEIMATTLSVESQLGSFIAAIYALLAGILIDQLGLGIGIGIVSLSALVIVLLFKFFNRSNEENNQK